MTTISLTKEALAWFKEDMDAQPGEAIRFFARYGGSSPIHEGFSIGVTKEQPDEAVVQIVQDDILFYIEHRDLWYFDEHDLHVHIDPTLGELTYSYEKA